MDPEQLGDLAGGQLTAQALGGLDPVAPRDPQGRRRREACRLERRPPGPEPAHHQRAVRPARMLLFPLLRSLEAEAAGPGGGGRPVEAARRPARLLRPGPERLDDPLVRPVAAAAPDPPRPSRPLDLAP